MNEDYRQNIEITKNYLKTKNSILYKIKQLFKFLQINSEFRTQNSEFMWLLIIILLLPIFSIAQTTYKGRITNANTKQPVPFATIGLMQENTGINADENGAFSLVSQSSVRPDSFQVSCVGYQTKKIPVSKTDFYAIELEELVTQLKEIKLSSKDKWTIETINKFSGNGNIGFTTNGSHTQVARLFTSPVENAILTGVRIRKRHYSYQSDKAIFRVRIYDIDTTTNGPSTDLCDEVIEINTSEKNITIDLEKYKIHIPGKQFFVAVEWLKIQYNEDRNMVEGKDGKVESITYRPSLAAYSKHPASAYIATDPNQIWIMSYQNQWIPLRWCDNVYISATIKY